MLVVFVLAIILPRLPSKKVSVDISMLPEVFIIFDFETTGLVADRHEIIEIGAIKVNRDGAEHTTFQSFVKPKKKIPKKITEITGITQEMVNAEGVAISEILPQFLEFIGDHHLVAYNISFDLAFLKSEMQRLDINTPLKNSTACALNMARRAWPGRKSYKLTDVAKDGNLSVDDAHRALSDCRRTLTIYTSAADVLRSAK